MNYLIDGHNLIPKVPGLSLEMLDDETRLVELLVRFSRGGRHKVEVFFDGAPAGQAGQQRYGRVLAHYVPARQTADDAIRGQLEFLGKSARNWTVVSSDGSVQAAAHAARAGSLKSEDFQAQLLAAQDQPASADPHEQPMSDDEVQEWLELFRRGGRK